MDGNLRDEVLIKHIKGECSSDENALVESWLKEPETYRHYSKLNRIWQETGKLPDGLLIDSNKAWKAIREKHLARKGNKRILPLYLKVAASLLILFGAFFMFRNTVDKAPEIIVVETGNKIKEVVLPDKSVVNLNANSYLSYSGNFKRNRNIKLKGEAFFNVTRDKKHPFVVNSKSTQIRVLGTSFNIKEQNGLVTVGVNTGRVEVSDSLLNKKTVLSPGEFVEIDQEKVRMTKGQHNNNNYMSWITKKIKFNDTPLADVVEFLSGYYKTELVIKNKELSNYVLTASFNDQGLAEVLEVVSLTLSLRVEKSGDIYYLIQD